MFVETHDTKVLKNYMRSYSPAPTQSLELDGRLQNSDGALRYTERKLLQLERFGVNGGVLQTLELILSTSKLMKKGFIYGFDVSENH